MATNAQAAVQLLLRFLTQDAKIPLGVAMSKVRELQARKLGTSQLIALADLDTISGVFPDVKEAKAVHNAAKRISKRKASDDSGQEPAKRPRKTAGVSGGADSIATAVADQEAELALPASDHTEAEINATVLTTNRAPLLLAFAVTLLRYTRPEQPLSSRLSLAQAMVSANAKTKAVSIGLSKESDSAELQGWGQGQPVIQIMGRDIHVMRRWGYLEELSEQQPHDASTRGPVPATRSTNSTEGRPTEAALWGIDLEALKKSNGPLVPGSEPASSAGLPIYSPRSARAYLLRSFARKRSETSETTQQSSTKRQKKADTDEREETLGFLLGALEMLYESWSSTLTLNELDRRAFAWYCSVRPHVEPGPQGWGGKNVVDLGEILKLRRHNDKDV